MLISPPKPFGSRRRFVRLGPPPTPPVALTLTAAEFGEKSWILLTFDRGIDIAGLDGSQIILDDGDSGFRFNATGAAESKSPISVQITLVEIGSSIGSGVHLSASGSSGIVAIGDGGTWDGVSELVLPFP